MDPANDDATRGFTGVGRWASLTAVRPAAMLPSHVGATDFSSPITQDLGSLRAAACSPIVDGSAAADRAQVRHGG